MKELHFKLLLQATGKVIVTLSLVLLADIVAVGFAFMFLMGDHNPTVPPYNYWKERSMAAGILLIYSIWMLGIGFNWQLTNKLTPRIIGFALGVMPVLCITLFAAYDLIVRHLL